MGASNRGMARWCGSSTSAELRARRGRSSGSRLWRGRRGSAGASERAHGHQQVKAGVWARCQAVAAARRATPARGRHAAEFLCRGRGVAQRDSEQARECGRAGGTAWAWAGEAAAGARRGAKAGRAASAAGPKARRKAHEGKNKIFQINLNSFFIQTKFWTKSKQFQTLGQK